MGETGALAHAGVEDGLGMLHVLASRLDRLAVHVRRWRPSTSAEP
ncbi:MAG TPA: hypothetical protein VNT60_08230 [Deinococcales bacterium]|nr:hypothetical protein [Deinococcales bacterium]